MSNPGAPTAADVVQSLADAADAARQAYLTAQAANPSSNLTQLYLDEMKAASLYSDAEDKALSNDPTTAQAQKDLDAATKNIRTKLGDLKDIAQCLAALDQLVKLATTLSKLMV